MATQLPPTPPLDAQGFSSNTWQRWLDILRKRLSEAYGPNNPPPEELTVGPTAASTAVLAERVSDTEVALQLMAVSPAVMFELCEQIINKNAASGYPGLTVTFQLQLFDATGAIETHLETLATTPQLYSLPDASGTIALLLQDAQFNLFGCNGQPPQPAVALPADATDLPTAIALVNAIKAALIADGIGA